MNHWIIAPVILPALLAPLIGFVMRHDIMLARVASIAGTCRAGRHRPGPDGSGRGRRDACLPAGRLAGAFRHRSGARPAVGADGAADVVLALIVLLHAVATGWDARGRHFHALFQFQLMGICGAFLTGDVFNLFVFFEILLIASYGLMIHGGGRERMRAGLQYVVMNLAGSTLFLFALGTLYASTGTLNIADLARAAARDPGRGGRACPGRGDASDDRLRGQGRAVPGAVLAARHLCQRPGAGGRAVRDHDQGRRLCDHPGPHDGLRPGHARQPRAWSAPGCFRRPWSPSRFGAFGVLGARRLMPLIAFAVVGSMGTLLIAVAVFTPAATTAALYYLVHSTFAAAALFLVADLVLARREAATLTRPAADRAERAVRGAVLRGCHRHGRDAAAQRVPGQAAGAGRAARAQRNGLGLERRSLSGSLLTIVGFARAGSTLFWKSTAVVPAPASGGDAEAPGTPFRTARRPGRGRPDHGSPLAMLAALPSSPARSRPIWRKRRPSCSTGRAISRPSLAPAEES